MSGPFALRYLRANGGGTPLSSLFLNKLLGEVLKGQRWFCGRRCVFPFCASRSGNAKHYRFCQTLEEGMGRDVRDCKGRFSVKMDL